jgi:hypothetical protein
MRSRPEKINFTLRSDFRVKGARIIIVIINQAYAGQVNCFTQLRALLVLHDHGNEICSETNSDVK